MKSKLLTTLLIITSILFACEDDESNYGGTANVNFSLEELVEIENATAALSINVGMDNVYHGGGSYTIDITGAQYGVDYETSANASNFTMEVPAGGLLSTFSIKPIDDDVIGEDKYLTVTISEASGSLQVGEQNVLTFRIIENDDPNIALVNFESVSQEMDENDTLPTTVNLSFDQATTDGGAITIEATGDAVYGTDYTIEGQSSNTFTLTVPGGATSANFNILSIDNDEFEADKNIVFAISEVDGGLTIGATSQTVVTIINDDASPNPVMDFTTSSMSVNEGDGTVAVLFDISGTTTADATVEISFSGDATLGSDFTVDGGSTNPYVLMIPAGSSSATLNLEILDDSDLEEAEDIVLTITSVTGGLLPGVNVQEMTMTIEDNDFASFNFLQTFEDATVSQLEEVGFEAFSLPTQDLPDTKKFKYNINAGKYADVDDVTQTSDGGLVLFYSNAQNGNGVIDNVVISPLMEVSGDVTVSLDLTYNQAPQFNNAVVTFYYSTSYTGSGVWNEGDWIEIDVETAMDMESEGYAISNYKRKEMNISPESNFYVSVRVFQTIDDTYWKTQWRLDNLKVFN
ncbi:Calx-beta domain-containing protein [Mangrovimonas futianensis]|uniref:Calx-beta domain-containing protein n=1 Tax=Mangrovimonas futianensis TaxID=2895523 RepID=UPI001E4D5636|nr:Calx-beta domain-containing protein [Mangrovimonas futianensis]MCF1420495.1 hypothetical protein [Mangrovimonas futianensis]